jgi:acyl-CoA thioester hydrolase
MNAAGAMDTAASNPQPKVFTWPVRIYWEDTDAGGIVFYANYLKFMERARTEWLRALGVDQSQLREQTGGMFVVTDTQLKYHSPARLDDQLLVTACGTKKTSITLTIAQEIRLLPNKILRKQLLNNEQFNMSPAELSALPLVCQGSIRIAWVDIAAMKPARIPPHLLEILE